MKVRRQFNLPLSYFGQGFQNLDYPIWNNPNSGILEIPTFLSVGKVYASDVFVKPSVAKKQLGAEITVTNPTGAAASGEISGPRLTTKPARPPKHLRPSRLRLRQTAMRARCQRCLGRCQTVVAHADMYRSIAHRNAGW
jgi:hypothetical protein